MTDPAFRVIGRKLMLADHQPRTLADTTFEQRRAMSAAELIPLMGKLHVNHPEYQKRPRSLLPMPNLADRQPMISHCDHTFLGEVRWALIQIMR